MWRRKESNFRLHKLFSLVLTWTNPLKWELDPWWIYTFLHLSMPSFDARIPISVLKILIFFLLLRAADINTIPHIGSIFSLLYSKFRDQMTHWLDGVCGCDVELSPLCAYIFSGRRGGGSRSEGGAGDTRARPRESCLFFFRAEKTVWRKPLEVS